jgi:hypothetical protein
MISAMIVTAVKKSDRVRMVWYSATNRPIRLYHAYVFLASVGLLKALLCLFEEDQSA